MLPGPFCTAGSFETWCSLCPSVVLFPGPVLPVVFVYMSHHPQERTLIGARNMMLNHLLTVVVLYPSPARRYKCPCDDISLFFCGVSDPHSSGQGFGFILFHSHENRTDEF